MITIPFTGSRSKSVKYFRLQLLFFFVFRFFIYLNAYGIMLLNAMLSTWGGGEEHSIFYYYNSELASITGGGGRPLLKFRSTVSPTLFVFVLVNGHGDIFF